MPLSPLPGGSRFCHLHPPLNNNSSTVYVRAIHPAIAGKWRQKDPRGDDGGGNLVFFGNSLAFLGDYCKHGRCWRRRWWKNFASLAEKFCPKWQIACSVARRRRKTKLVRDFSSRRGRIVGLFYLGYFWDDEGGGGGGRLLVARGNQSGDVE